MIQPPQHWEVVSLTAATLYSVTPLKVDDELQFTFTSSLLGGPGASAWGVQNFKLFAE
jgi:hypothetical protein